MPWKFNELTRKTELVPYTQGFDYNPQKLDYNSQGFGNNSQGFDYNSQGFGNNSQGFDYKSIKFDYSLLGSNSKNYTKGKKGTDATGTATKTEDPDAKAPNGLNIAAALSPAISQGIQSAISSSGGTVADSTASNAASALGSIAGNFGPWGQGIQIALETFGAVNNIVGGALSKKAGTTRQVNLDGIGSGYGGVTGSDAVMGKAFGWTDSKKMKDFAAAKNNVIQQAGLAKAVSKQQDQLKMGALDLAQQKSISNINKLGGFDPTKGLLAKKGTKLQLKNIKAKANHIKNFILLDENTGETISDDVTLFASGGQFNLIPEGALHAHKHNIEGVEDITTKGIPVITVEEGGKIEQHAEIERNEITFHLEVSKELEALNQRYKEGDNTAALEAGKLLVFEILENTIDNTGLIQTI